MPLSDAQIQANLQKKFGSKSARTGGRCTMRRKFKAQSKSASQDDKRLNSQLKKLSVTQIPAIEEVNLFKDDNTVVHFTKPRVQAEIQSNTYVVSGECATKKLEDLFPHILPQLGVEHMDVLKNFASTLGAKADLSNIGTDDAVPELIDDDFEQVANADAAAPKAENAEAASASAPSASTPAVEAVAAAAPAAASSEDNKEQSGAAEEKKKKCNNQKMLKKQKVLQVRKSQLTRVLQLMLKTKRPNHPLKLPWNQMTDKQWMCKERKE